MCAEQKNEESIFYAALEIESSDKRSTFLKKACGSDAHLIARVEALLAVQEKERSILEDAVPFLETTLQAAPVTEEPGTVIGNYKLLELIGEGGMAVVYMAEQERPVRRKVALKIIKLGMDTKQVIARFEAERQALAIMEHPNIAKVFDAGTTEAGRPYFVMELVKGVSITEYCDKNKLGTRERLELFIQVCKAIQHAHQKGIIHRDLKPTNVMVTLHDGNPVPKVIDFGIAKATNQRLTEKTLFTRYAQMIGTPAYMSPEQAEMSGLDVDTRTDVYSLGVLLYELLTGTTPFDAEKLRSAGYIELQRIIREEEPTKPSTKLNTLGDGLTEVAKHRATNPDLLKKSIRGDLDWMVMKSLEKDRTRRYETVHALVEDIQRHLRNEPILAGSPGVVYRLQKYFRRHRYQVITAAVVMVLIANLAVGLVMYLRSLRVRWARQEALPMITRLVGQKDYLAAFFLAKKAKEYIPDDPTLENLWSEISRTCSVQTEPEGADVYYKEYTDIKGQGLYLGRSPIEKIRFPKGIYRWQIIKEGFETRECVKPWGDTLKITLKERGGHSNMVPINSEDYGTYLIDKCEVTNEEYKEFIDSGGYQKEQYWKHPFVKDEQEISWEEAISQFVDKTGQAGPATWEGGTYPERQAKYPVSGVSWYEAAAYAEFIGKSLPTVIHWCEGACIEEDSIIIPYSNFGKGPAAVGSHPGMGQTGLYDMAGNVREWCLNAVDGSGSQHYILGGAWNEPEYMFGIRNVAPTWNRSSQNGFRCAIYSNKDSLSKPLFESIKRLVLRDISQIKPPSDEEFRSDKGLYSYDRTDLEAKIEYIDEIPKYGRVEKITFNAAYKDERVIAYLFVPNEGGPPYQPVVFFPSAAAWRFPSSEKNLRDFSTFGFIIRSGRAVIHPVYKGTYERRFEEGPPNPAIMPIAHRNWFVQMYQDLARSIDYLESRDDIDLSKLTYLGSSRGAWTGPLWVALEDRIRLAIFAGGGCWIWQDSPMPSADPMRLAARVKVPTLMLNGVYDAIFPYDKSQKPLFEFLGTPTEHKVHKTYPTGHSIIGVSREQKQHDVLEWLDKYLGPVE